MSQEQELQPDGVAPLVLERDGTAEHPVIRASGEIDVATSPLLRSELATVIGSAPASVTVDLAQVSFIDSSGLGVLVGALKRVREMNPDAKLRVVHPQDAVKKVFDITGLDGLFDLRN
jgi:anti-sigma B factor antagonist